MSDFNNNSLSAGRGKALINAITFIKTIERSSPAKVNFPCIAAVQNFRQLTDRWPEWRQAWYRHYANPVIWVKIFCLKFCMHLNAYLFILSKVALIYFVTEKKPEKMDEWPWKCQDLLESILCLMTPLHHILLYSPLHEFDAPLYFPNQKHHCYLKTALQNLWKLMPWKLIKLLHVTVFNLFQLCS